MGAPIAGRKDPALRFKGGVNSCVLDPTEKGFHTGIKAKGGTREMGSARLSVLGLWDQKT